MWELETGGLNHGLDHGPWSHLRSVGPGVVLDLAKISSLSGEGLQVANHGHLLRSVDHSTVHGFPPLVAPATSDFLQFDLSSILGVTN